MILNGLASIGILQQAPFCVLLVLLLTLVLRRCVHALRSVQQTYLDEILLICSLIENTFMCSSSVFFSQLHALLIIFTIYDCFMNNF